MNNKLIKQYIKDNDGTGTYLLKDKGEGDGVFIAKWDMDIDEPTDDQLTYAQTIIDSEKIITDAKRALSRSDKDLARLSEDLYDILVAKGTISASDISQELRDTMTDRKAERAKL